MGKEQKQDIRAAAEAQRSAEPPWAKTHGFEGPMHSKVKGGLHTKADLKRAGSPQGDRIGERSKGLS